MEVDPQAGRAPAQRGEVLLVAAADAADEVQRPRRGWREARERVDQHVVALVVPTAEEAPDREHDRRPLRGDRGGPLDRRREHAGAHAEPRADLLGHPRGVGQQRVVGGEVPRRAAREQAAGPRAHACRELIERHRAGRARERRDVEGRRHEQVEPRRRGGDGGVVLRGAPAEAPRRDVDAQAPPGGGVGRGARRQQHDLVPALHRRLQQGEHHLLAATERGQERGVEADPHGAPSLAAARCGAPPGRGGGRSGPRPAGQARLRPAAASCWPGRRRRAGRTACPARRRWDRR